MTLTAQTVEKLRGIVNASCADAKTNIPGATVVVVDKDGNDLFVRHQLERLELQEASFVGRERVVN